MKISRLPADLVEKANLTRPGSWPVEQRPCTWALGKPEPAVTEAHWSWFGGIPESEGDPSDIGGSPRLGVPTLGVAVAFGEMPEPGAVLSWCGSPGLGLLVLGEL